MKRIKARSLWRIAILLLLLLLMSGCSAFSPSKAGMAATPAEDGRLRIGVSFPTTKLLFRKTMYDLLQTYAEEHSDEMEFLILDADSSQEQQNHDLLDMIHADVDGIILIPYTMEGETSAVSYALERKIPILTLDNSITVSYQRRTIGYVGANHEKMGRQAGELLIASLEKRFGDHEEWKVLYLTGVSNSSGAVDRDKGIRSVLEANNRVNLIAEYNGEFTRENARSIMEDCLLVYPDLQGVICQNDLMAEGVCEALDAVGRTGEIAVIGIDGQRSVVERIARGDMDGTVIQYPSMILDAVENMKSFLDSKQQLTYTFEETTPIDAENAQEYLDQNLPW